MKLIVAVDDRWGIGKGGDLLLSIPEDMRFFRETTRRAVLVMGYNTLLSFPGGRPLPGRMNIVLNDAAGCTVPGAVVCDSMEQLFSILRDMNTDDIFVIGGGLIYRQLLPYCDTSYITKMRFDGEADTYIPNLDELDEWSVISESDIMDYDGLKYSFVEYRNAAPEKIAFSGRNADMPAYFGKKAEIAFDLPDCGDEEFRAELAARLCAYFRPFEKGMSAADVAAFLSRESAGDETFEAYLKRIGALATPEDIKALAEKYGAEKSYSVKITKDNYAEFCAAVRTDTAEQLAKKFA